MKTIHLIGYAYGDAGKDPEAYKGPNTLASSLILQRSGVKYDWETILKQESTGNIINDLKTINTNLSKYVSEQLHHNKATVVLGGDHTSAIGTWSGAWENVRQKGDLGLIWIDAHMDSHTPETSETGRIHGMPLAVLLGAGEKELTNISYPYPKLKPHNVCLIGVRSYEEGEAKFLKDLGVRIFFMDEVNEKGMGKVMQEAVDHVSKYTVGFGISLDIDGIDPIDAPAVSVPEDGGIRADDLLFSIPLALTHPNYLLTEIVEFNPGKDKQNLTEKLIIKLLNLIQLSTVSHSSYNKK
jgi:arginase